MHPYLILKKDPPEIFLMINEILEILIVEDNIIIQQVIEICLISLGYSVCGIVATGEAAIDFIREKKPDAVLMDITLDGHTDGIDTAIAIKKVCQIPIVFLTSSTKAEDLERAEKIPADGFIGKPFRDKDIHVALKSAIPDHGDTIR
jgi:CheY-like chemotaxis protein